MAQLGVGDWSRDLHTSLQPKLSHNSLRKGEGWTEISFLNTETAVILTGTRSYLFNHQEFLAKQLPQKLRFSNPQGFTGNRGFLK